VSARASAYLQSPAVDCTRPKYVMHCVSSSLVTAVMHGACAACMAMPTYVHPMHAESFAQLAPASPLAPPESPDVPLSETGKHLLEQLDCAQLRAPEPHVMQLSVLHVLMAEVHMLLKQVLHAVEGVMPRSAEAAESGSGQVLPVAASSALPLELPLPLLLELEPPPSSVVFAAASSPVGC
jgi:hypothetical protein